MAKRYDYTNTYFNERVLTRASIKEKNLKLNGIAHAVGYSGKIHVYIMESFYGAVVSENIEKYQRQVSPIDYFSLKTLKVFDNYLGSIIEEWNQTKLKFHRLSGSDLSDVIKQQSRIARELARQNDALPEYNDNDSKLPTNIDAPMIKKCIENLKTAGMQTPDNANSILQKKEQATAKQENSLDKDAKLITKVVKNLVKDKDVIDTIKQTADQILHKQQETKSPKKEQEQQPKPEIKPALKPAPKKRSAKVSKEPEYNLFNFEEVLAKEAKEKAALREQVEKISEEKLDEMEKDPVTYVQSLRIKLGKLYEQKEKVEDKMEKNDNKISDTRSEIKANRGNVLYTIAVRELNQCLETKNLLDTSYAKLTKKITRTEHELNVAREKALGNELEQEPVKK
jgi:hypothetical protein